MERREALLTASIIHAPESNSHMVLAWNSVKQFTPSRTHYCSAAM